MSELTKEYTIDELTTLLSGLLGRDVIVESGDSLDLVSADALAVYVTSDGHVRGGCACDVPMANFAGSALTMLPAKESQAHTKAGELPELVFENFEEVLNICTQLFHDSEGELVRLYQVFDVREDAPPDPLPEFVRTASSRIGLTVEIEDYGVGRLTVLAA